MSDVALLTTTEVVEKYGVSRKTIQRWVNSDPPRIVPAHTLPGLTGAHLFTPEEAERAFGSHKETKAAEKAPEAVVEPVVKPKAPRKPRAKQVVADEPEQLLLPMAEEAPAPEVEPEHFDDDDDDFEPPAAKK